MRTHALAAALAATTLAGSTLVGPPSVALTAPGSSPAAASDTVRERGIVLECSGATRGLRARTSVYENSTYGNTFEVVLGDPRHGNGKSVAKDADLWDGREVRASMTFRGTKISVTGTARKVGKRIPVHEELDDGGQHVVADGFHKRLRHHLVLHRGRKHVDLTCTAAFYYDLDVTREPVG